MVAVVGITLKERPEPTWGEQFIRDTFGFFQSLVYKPAREIAGFFETINEWRILYSENQRLKANLQDNAKLSAEIRQLELENKTLKEMLGYKEDRQEYTLLAARVINRSPDRWYQMVTIDRGKKHGIRPNMAVVTSDGLIGRIKSVSQFTSQVELLSDVNRTNHISAIVQGQENIFGVIEGYDLERRALLFQKIPKETPLEVGQTVITSGIGGVFPPGLYIGQIVEVLPDQYDLTQTALVEPAANLYHLDFVFVVQQTSLEPVELPQTDVDKVDEE
jgi:rod shape-determining protein MreC